MTSTSWAIWDRSIYDASPAPDPEEGIYEEGFSTREAAEAAIPQIKADLNAHGFRVTDADFLVRPRAYTYEELLDLLGWERDA